MLPFFLKFKGHLSVFERKTTQTNCESLLLLWGVGRKERTPCQFERGSKKGGWFGDRGEHAAVWPKGSMAFRAVKSPSPIVAGLDAT